MKNISYLLSMKPTLEVSQKINNLSKEYNLGLKELSTPVLGFILPENKESRLIKQLENISFKPAYFKLLKFKDIDPELKAELSVSDNIYLIRNKFTDVVTNLNGYNELGESGFNISLLEKASVFDKTVLNSILSTSWTTNDFYLSREGKEIMEFTQ